MISAYDGIRWGTGMVREFQYEKGQSRIGAPPWDKTLEFIENSPIFWVEKVNTPYLRIHNDEATTRCPGTRGSSSTWRCAAWAKKPTCSTTTASNTASRNRDNMKHWTVHMDEFFDHYLLGKPRPEWMDKGYLDRGTRDLSAIYRTATEDKD